MKKCTFYFGRSASPKKMSPTIARYQETWRAEVNSVALYRTLADLESQSQIAQVYRRLAAVEERHARFWEK